MKHTFMLIIVMLIAAAGFGEDLVAQTQQNPNSYPPTYYYYTAAADSPVFRSTIDTLSSSGIKLGAASFLTAVVVNDDSMLADVYFDFKPRGSDSWGQVYADSVIKYVADTSEFKLRLPGTDNIGRIDGVLRSRVSQRATSDYDTTGGYWFQWIWKP
ncbi:MAG: hypothetical protein ACYC09_12950 [Bacteroidota bacterium]